MRVSFFGFGPWRDTHLDLKWILKELGPDRVECQSINSGRPEFSAAAAGAVQGALPADPYAELALGGIW